MPITVPSQRCSKVFQRRFPQKRKLNLIEQLLAINILGLIPFNNIPLEKFGHINSVKSINERKAGP